MKILHTIPDLGISSGGPSQSVFYTVEGLQRLGVDATILTYQPKEGDTFVSDIPFIKEISRYRSIFAYSPKFKEYLKNNLDYDLYHTQAIWQYPTYITVKLARKSGKPYIMTPRGMLYPQAIAHSKIQKKLFLKLSLLKDLNQASVIHTTSIDEMNYLRDLKITSSIAVIPNPVDFLNSIKNPSPKKIRIGYLGRIHPRKNIERLIYVWDKLSLRKTDFELAIIGDGDQSYLQFLKEEAKRLNINNVIFTGFLSGKDKENAIDSLSYLVVPSDFENFGMIVPEALARGVPVIASKGTPWQELNTHHCGWWVDNDIGTLAKTIDIAINTPEVVRQEMGENGRKLVVENYSIEVVAKKMKQLYEWILYGGGKPDFVYL